MQLKATYSAREVVVATGLTARHLQVWDAGGLLVPAIHPRRTEAGGYTERRYTPLDVLELLVLADLHHRGFSMAALHAIVVALKGQFGVRLYDATGGGSPVRLLTDGEDVYARAADGTFYNLLKAPTQPLLIAGDEKQLKEVKGKAPRASVWASGLGRSSRGRRPAAE